MFILEHHIRKGVYAEFKTNETREPIHFIGAGRTPTIFTEEHLAHEARSDFHLEEKYNVIKLVKEY